jgi:hypothetical protein
VVPLKPSRAVSTRTIVGTDALAGVAAEVLAVEHARRDRAHPAVGAAIDRHQPALELGGVEARPAAERILGLRVGREHEVLGAQVDDVILRHVVPGGPVLCTIHSLCGSGLPTTAGPRWTSAGDSSRTPIRLVNQVESGTSSRALTPSARRGLGSASGRLTRLM